MKNVLILHGLNGDPNANWYPYLATQLRKHGYQASGPRLHKPLKPDIDKVFQALSKERVFNSETIIVGHSSGAVLACGILQNLPPDLKVNKVFLVGGFIDRDLTRELYRQVPRAAFDNLFPKTWNWGKIKHQAKRFVVIQSDNDPFVPLKQGKILAKKLNAEEMLLKGQGHFSISTSPQYREFPTLLEKILE